MSNSTLVVVGSGRGIGVSTAAVFASKKFNNIALISRSTDHLERDCRMLLKATSSIGRQIAVRTWAVDITNTQAFKKVLSEVENFGEVTCVHFNAARVDMSTLLEFEDDEILYDFKTTTIALHNAAAWAIPILQTVTDKPTILVTSSMLWKDPIHQMFSLCLVKAAQRNLVLSLQLAFPDVHIALLNVQGQVTPESKSCSPKIVAGKFWELYDQEKDDWMKEMDIWEV